MTKLAIPAIHNNGTSKADLLEALSNAYLSLKESLNKLSYTIPHQRDYYIKQINDFETAKKQHVERYKKIKEVMKELEEIAIAIQTNER